MIFTQLIKANLETRILGRDIEYFVRVESTNREAMELLGEGAREGTVVVTDTQTAGRGRHNRVWFSGPGKGLTFSVILKPGLSGPATGVISLMGAVAAAETIERLDLTPRVKWPNDLLLMDRKCGGILVEARFQGNVMSSAIMGIGINVNETDDDFPEDLRPGTISLLIAKESPVQRELVLAWILNSLERWYDRLKSGDSGSIISAWKKRCDHLGKEVRFSRKGETRTGIFA
ncbi:MAG: biotin--[acetyl-CoA-carboxylase] ligase, partial [Fidelibacterota bacterium]